MSYMITHFYEGGTKEQYDATLAAVHPEGGQLPEGQTHHFAGPTGGGFLVVAVWESKAANDTFINDVLMPTLPAIDNGFASPPQERAAEVANQVTATNRVTA